MAEATNNAFLPLTGTGTGRTRMSLALHQLLAACRFAARTLELERGNLGQPFGGFWEEILHNSLGVATLTVASLESYANELYFEGSILEDSLRPSAAAEISTLIDREPVLKKYSLALAVRLEKRLNFGSPEVQDADALIKLRNSVVHFRSEWFGEQQSHEKLSRLLQHRFQPSPFLPNEPLFPRSWASASFAFWAVQSSVAFIKNFYAEIGLPCPLDQFDEQITLLLNPA